MKKQVLLSGNFDQNRAEDTALVLKYGSLPIEFTTSVSLGG